MVEWLSVTLRTKWLWVRVLLQSLKLYFLFDFVTININDIESALRYSLILNENENHSSSIRFTCEIISFVIDSYFI